jgi:glutamine amidotransferase
MTSTSTPVVTVVDYGIGNLYSVQRALETCGAVVDSTADPVRIAQAQRLVLPGVGAFADGMQGLRERGLIQPLRDYAASGRPLLGICLGMQMLATVSEEFGEHQGLDLVPGRVLPVPAESNDGSRQKIPHIGWVPLLATHGIQSWQGSVLQGSSADTAVYLVHSFAVVPSDPADRLADCVHGGHVLCAALRRGNIHGCQFHPEKSGPAGLQMLSQFIAL